MTLSDSYTVQYAHAYQGSGFTEFVNERLSYEQGDLDTDVIRGFIMFKTPIGESIFCFNFPNYEGINIQTFN